MKQFFNLKIMTAVAVFFSILFFTCKKSDNTQSNTPTYSGTTGNGTTTGGTSTGGTSTGGTTTGGTTGYGTTTGYGSTTDGTTTGGTTGGTTTSGTAASVLLQNSKFNPSSLNVGVGATVTWINKDSYTHTVTSDTKVFDSGDVIAGGNYSYTFNTIGTFSYYCKYHKAMGMTGTIIVK